MTVLDADLDTVGRTENVEVAVFCIMCRDRRRRAVEEGSIRWRAQVMEKARTRWLAYDRRVGFGCSSRPVN